MTPDPSRPIPVDVQARPRLAAGARLQTDRLTGQPVLLFPEGMLKLNPTGSAILELCDGHRSIAELLASLAEKFDVPADVLRADVAEYLGRLIQRGLVQMQVRSPMLPETSLSPGAATRKSDAMADEQAGGGPSA